MNSPSMRTVPNPNCLFCGVPGEVLYSGLADHLFLVPGSWQLRQCADPKCGLVWTDPAPLAEDLGLAYQTYYTHAVSAGNSPGILQRASKSAYWAGVKLLSLMSGLYRERRRFKSMLLGDLSPGRLFDVGCGDGKFLRLMAEKGWRGSGMDFDAAAIENGRTNYGLDLSVGDFQTAHFDNGDFDAVTVTHVIEHVPDPLACLKKCRELLRSGGRLVVTTPNVRSLGHERFQRNWRGLEPPRHLHIFTPGLLAECARRAGLSVVRTGSTAANADYFANASLAIKNIRPDATGGIGGGWDRRFALDAVAFQYREYFTMHRHPDWGEEAFLVAERSG
ncbi:MAG TPA: class I SAM-dependent methyltransferase [Bryobacteraceae bacterium]|nr:class I SAM-dependent methyltransferase [Bryobacteraceae bacterium]